MPSFDLPFLNSSVTNNISSAITSLTSTSSVINSVAGLLGSSPSNATNTSAPLAFTIDQQERLFTTRSRQVLLDDTHGNRGQRSYIKLLTSDPSKAFDRHTEHADAKPTSLGTSRKGVLSDAITGGTFGGYADFLLTDIQGSFDEKIQIVEVFGDAEVVYYFGRQPIMLQMSGILIDSADNNWFVEWIEMYSHVLRGTQLARNYELIKIVTPNMSMIGTITRMGWNQNAARDVDIPFNFTFLVKQIIPMPIIGSGRPLTKDAIVNANKAETFKTQSQIVSQKTALSKLAAVIQNPISTIKDYSSALISNTILGGIGLSTPSLGSIINGGTSSFLSKGIDSLTAGISSTTSSNGNIFSNVTSNLAGIRASLFSPVYGVLSSLTKLIKSVGGNSAGIISSFTNPVRDILRDIRNISNQAIGVVNLINGTIHNAANTSHNLDADLRSTLALLKKTGGVISTAPQTITSNLRDMVNAGKLPATVGFLQNNNRSIIIGSSSHTSSKLVLLNSGPRHSAEQGAKL
jgi:hypothetical protein